MIEAELSILTEDVTETGEEDDLGEMFIAEQLQRLAGILND